jgi:hypothetical protein
VRLALRNRWLGLDSGHDNIFIGWQLRARIERRGNRRTNTPTTEKPRGEPIFNILRLIQPRYSAGLGLVPPAAEVLDQTSEGEFSVNALGVSFNGK